MNHGIEILSKTKLLKIRKNMTILIVFFFVFSIAGKSQSNDSLKKFFIKPSICDTLTYEHSHGFKLSNKESKLFNRYNLTKTRADHAKYSIYGANCGYVNSFNFNNRNKGAEIYYYYDFNQNSFWQELAKEIIIGFKNK